MQSIIDQMTVYAPVASQVYQRNVEPGEYVSPGVPLVTLIDLSDLWIHFDLREDLVKPPRSAIILIRCIRGPRDHSTCAQAARNLSQLRVRA